MSHKSSRSLVICRLSCRGGKCSLGSPAGKEGTRFLQSRVSVANGVKRATRTLARVLSLHFDGEAMMQCSLLPTNCDDKQTGMQTATLRYKLGCKLRYCDTNWDANRETAMPCNATAYYCHHDWDSTAI
ncbi:unnamed protein product [Sphagnum troendelagicum]|uniref:Uncharacterized protein n=1 Tax=Sphagnum troendelagicum TaxID=128251 RepID=A0ABP0TZD9_9BRYO